jgi:hypothetical protein
MYRYETYRGPFGFCRFLIGFDAEVKTVSTFAINASDL